MAEKSRQGGGQDVTQLVKTLLPVLLPVLVPKVWAWFTKARSKKSVRPLSLGGAVACLALLLTAVVQLVYGGIVTVPGVGVVAQFGAPENVILATASRLETDGDVVRGRLAKLRGLAATALAPADARVATRFGTLEQAYMYARFGPDYLWCEYCEGPSSFEYYAMPATILPYVANAAVVLACTVSPNRYVKQLRLSALGALALLLGLQVAVTARVPTKQDGITAAHALRWFYWEIRGLRTTLLVVYNVVLAGAVYLAAVGRLFDSDEPPAERVAALNARLQSILAQEQIATLSRSVSSTVSPYRERYLAYWKARMRSVDAARETPAVAEAVDDARTRINEKKYRSQMHAYLDTFMPKL